MTKILIADDEPNILMLTQVVFKDLGMEVHTASNGEDAIKKAASVKPDIMIVDIIMPKKDGFAVCKAIRNNPETADTPIIILSALGDEYNKITGFEEGADDYVTKPFNVEELKARVKKLLQRHQIKQAKLIPTKKAEKKVTAAPVTEDKEFTKTGIPLLDKCLNGGFPKGSNILVIGPLGQGKSTLARKFMAEGLQRNERCLYVALDDAPKQIRTKLTSILPKPVTEYEDIGLIRFVDAYSWSSFAPAENEPFAINGILELNQLSGVISDAGYELGQTIQNKMGGRRIIDSISSLLINFELASVQRFINQIGRTAISFGGVTTLYILEAGTVDSQILNNIKYIMDGILEFGEINGKKAMRVASMKWANFDNQWVVIEE